MRRVARWDQVRREPSDVRVRIREPCEKQGNRPGVGPNAQLSQSHPTRSLILALGKLYESGDADSAHLVEDTHAELLGGLLRRPVAGGITSR